MSQDNSLRRSAPTWVLSSSSVLLFIALLTFAMHVRLGLGHWPEPMIEDYSTIAFRVHEYVVAALLYLSLFVAIPAGAAVVCFRRFRLSLHTHLMQIAVFATGWVVIVVTAVVDPTSFTEWLMD